MNKAARLRDIPNVFPKYALPLRELGGMYVEDTMPVRTDDPYGNTPRPQWESVRNLDTQEAASSNKVSSFVAGCGFVVGRTAQCQDYMNLHGQSVIKDQTKSERQYHD